MRDISDRYKAMENDDGSISIRKSDIYEDEFEIKVDDRGYRSSESFGLTREELLDLADFISEYFMTKKARKDSLFNNIRNALK